MGAWVREKYKIVKEKKTADKEDVLRSVSGAPDVHPYYAEVPAVRAPTFLTLSIHYIHWAMV